MKSIISTFIKRTVTTTMVFAALSLVGVISVSRLPVELLPDVEFPKLTVITPFENAAPSEVEKLVTVRIEEAVTAVSGVSGISSESIEGMSIVKVSFRWGTDMEMALIEAKEKVDLARGELPEDTGKSIVVRYDPADEPVMIYSVSLKNGESRETRRRVEKEVVPFIERISGVSMVDILGGYKREIQVDVDNSRLFSHSISLREIAERISMANYSYPAGNIIKNEKEYQVRTAGEFVSLSDIRSVVTGYNDRGVPVYLRDIAEVKDSFKDKKSVIRFNGREGVALLIKKEPGKNTIETCENIEQTVSEITGKNGAPFNIVPVYNQSSFIRNSVNNVVLAAVLGGVISFFVLFFFLKSPGPPLVIATAIPVSMCGTFLLMHIYGITINSMSLGGLAIGSGMTVDAGIVVLEAIYIARIENENLSMAESAVRGTVSVAAPVTASVLSTVVVFLPIVFLEGLAGAVFRDLALAVSFSIIISLFSSLTLVPMLASIDMSGMKPGFPGSSGLKRVLQRMYNLSERMTERITLFYERTIISALRKRRLVVSLGMASLAAGIFLFLFIEKEVMPSVDPGEFSIEVEMPGGTPLARTAGFCGEIEQRLLTMKGVKYVFTKAGCDPEDNISERISGKGSDSALIRVYLDRDAGCSSSEIIHELRGNINGSKEVTLSFNLKEDLVGSLFPGRGAFISVELYGNDTAELRDGGKKIAEIMGSFSGLERIHAVMDRVSPELMIEIDRERASSMGLDVENISSGIAMAVRGEISTRLRERDDEVDIRIRLSERDRGEPASINNIILKTETGEVVPLAGFAAIKESSGSVKILRREQSRVNVIKADILPGYEQVVNMLKKKVTEGDILPGLDCVFADGEGEIRDVFNAMLFAVMLSILFIYMLLAGQFQSFRDPLIIMLSIPVTFSGISLSLLLTGQSLNINSGIGIIMLCGTVVNNGIVLFDYINTERKKGTELEKAIRDAGSKRLIPILMTAFTTVLAVFPIALGMGEGAEIQRPLAVTIIGGTTVSTVLTLVLIPVIYAELEKRREARG
ncbi:MAG TPA: efflux RND transporter permease subunit [Spirochaetota bacterium]|nr:efflux RND transporter permease subunit [Spirochaetota bacterium]